MSAEAPESGASETADADLVLRTRSGDATAFGELWRRHYGSGVTVARSITSAFDADDLVQESYTRIYQSILKGGGPTGSFRAYLFTSIRNTAASWGRSRRETAIDELDAVEDPASSEEASSAALDRSLTHQAFRSLPTRWQEVLWYSEIEQMKPAEIAPLLGLKPAAVSQLVFRAREGLREAWIQAHLRSVADGSDCQWAIEHLGAHARGNLGRRDHARLTTHLADCARCTIVAGEAEEVSHRLALILLPLAAGSVGAAGYLAALQGGGVPLTVLAAMPSGVVAGAVSAGAPIVAAPAVGAPAFFAPGAGVGGSAAGVGGSAAGSTATAATLGAGTAATTAGAVTTTAAAGGVVAGAAVTATTTTVGATAVGAGVFSAAAGLSAAATSGLVAAGLGVAGVVVAASLTLGGPIFAPTTEAGAGTSVVEGAALPAGASGADAGSGGASEPGLVGTDTASTGTDGGSSADAGSPGQSGANSENGNASAGGKANANGNQSGNANGNGNGNGNGNANGNQSGNGNGNGSAGESGGAGAGTLPMTLGEVAGSPFGQGRYLVTVSLSTTPGATVIASLDGAVVQSVTADGTGGATVSFEVTRGQLTTRGTLVLAASDASGVGSHTVLLRDHIAPR